MAKANHIDFAEMDVGELDELEKKLVELKKQKMMQLQKKQVVELKPLCIIVDSNSSKIIYKCCNSKIKVLIAKLKDEWITVG